MNLELKVGHEVKIKCGFNTGKVGHIVHVCDRQVCVSDLIAGATSLYSPPISDNDMEILGWNPDIEEIDVHFL